MFSLKDMDIPLATLIAGNQSRLDRIDAMLKATKAVSIIEVLNSSAASVCQDPLVEVPRSPKKEPTSSFWPGVC